MDWIRAFERAMAAVMLAGVAFVAGSAFEASRLPQDLQPATAVVCEEDEVRMEGEARCQHLEGTWRFAR